MKNISLVLLLIGCISFESCKNNEEKKEADTAKAKVDKIVSTACYKAIYENDTIDLKVNTLENGKISGDMLMKVAKMKNKIGELSGEFHGDTLFASYTFIEGTNKEVTYKNPMAFLKKADTLILGNGQIETSMGASYFVKGQPIDFEKVKYKFSKVDCVEK